MFDKAIQFNQKFSDDYHYKGYFIAILQQMLISFKMFLQEDHKVLRGK